MGGNIYTYVTMLGKISISDDGNGHISGIYLPSCNLPCMTERESHVIKEAANQIEEYLVGKRTIFDVPCILEGTEFQESVWRELVNIPYGTTRSYSEIAKRIGRPGAARAVGTACGANPIPLIIPCHRVAATNGLGGYAGGLSMKKRLLEIEGL